MRRRERRLQFNSPVVYLVDPRLVLIGGLVFYLLEQRKLTRSGVADIDKMDGKTFEKCLRVFFKKLGDKVERTKYIEDYGADLIVTKNGIRMVIPAKAVQKRSQCKAVEETVASKCQKELSINAEL